MNSVVFLHRTGHHCPVVVYCRKVNQGQDRSPLRACRAAFESLSVTSIEFRKGNRPKKMDVPKTTKTTPKTTKEFPELDCLAPANDESCLGLLSHYRVLGVLGSGGMGIVLRAYDRKRNQDVAIKLLKRQFTASDWARSSFLREGQLATTIHHENVVQTYAVDACHDLPFLVMEYVQGGTVQEILNRNGPLPVAEILRIGTQTAYGLSAIHAHGLIHGDIKPANILLDEPSGLAKISDFGLARIVDARGKTRRRNFVGTPQYMSLEQAERCPLDSRTDLFNFGGLLYAMSTGKPPFPGSSSLAVLRKVRRGKPRPIRRLNPAIPAELSAIIHRLLSKYPQDRYKTALEVAALLNELK
jgi:serine/threonine protein kinase